MRYADSGPLINPSTLTAVFTAVFVCILSFSVRAEHLLDRITKVNPQTIQDCGPAEQYVQQKYNDKFSSDFYTVIDVEKSKTTGYNSCSIVWEVKYKAQNTADKINTYRIARDHVGPPATQCPPDGNLEFSAKSKDSSGNEFCINPDEAAEKDSCDDVNLQNSHLSSAPNLSCIARPDGSMCPAKRISTIQGSSGTSTHFYITNTDASGSACYGRPVDSDGTITTGEAETETSPEKDFVNDCVGTFCPADPTAHCANGICPPSCGTINGQFYCDADAIQNNEGRDPTVTPITPVERTEEESTTSQFQQHQGNFVDGQISTGLAQEFAMLQGLLAQVAANTRNGPSATGGSNGSDMSGVESGLEEIKESFNVTSSGKGNLGTEEEWQSEVDSKQQLLDDKIAEVKDTFSNLFSLPESTGSFTGCFTITEFGGTQQACVDDYQDELKILSFVILFIFALVSISILVR